MSTLTLDEIPEDLIITMTDIKNVGYCASGTRRWFTAHGLDFRDMVKNGIQARTLFGTNDAYGIRVVESKMTSIANG